MKKFLIHNSKSLIQSTVNPRARGFTVLYAVLIASLVLAIGVSLFSITFKQVQLSSEARESHRAIFAADGALECALLWDLEHPTYSSSPFGDFQDMVNIASGLEGFWRMDEGNPHSGFTADSSGNGHTGALLPGIFPPNPFAFGHQGNSLGFDGSNDYVAIRDMHYDEPQEAVTVTAWVWHSDISGGQNVASFGGQSQGYWRLIVNGGNPRFRVFTNGGYRNANANSSDDIAPGEWHHVAGVFNGATGEIQIYVDGDLSNTNSQGGSTFGTGLFDQYGYIGAEPAEQPGFDPGPNGLYFDGGIDTVRIYDRALNDDEIKAIYAQDSLQVHWTFNETGGNIAFDSSGLGRHGALQADAEFGTDGQIGGAVSLDGSGDYVEFGDTSPFLHFGDYTVTLWAEANIVPQANFTGVFSNLDGPADASSFQIDIGADSGTAAYRFNTTGGVRCDITPLSQSWQFLGVRQDGNTVEVFDDENSASCLTGIGSMNFRDYLVGRNRGGGGNFFDGLVDDVRVYNEAIHNEEIERLHELGGGAPDFIPPIGDSQPELDANTAMCHNQDIIDANANWTVDTGPYGGGGAFVSYEVDFGDGTCAIVTVEKDEGATTIESRGYSTCNENDPRRVERALRALY